VVLRICTCDGPRRMFDTAPLRSGAHTPRLTLIRLPSCLKNALMRMWMLAVEFTIRLVVFWRLLLVFFTR